MRHLLFSLIFAILAIAVHAQDPVLIMTTNKSINSQFSFGISANAANTPIQIDWGNGVKENFTIGVTTEFFGYPLLGSSVKIWGNGIASLTASSKELTELDVTRATSLTYLYIKTNQITTLDLSNCTVLSFVDCSENLLTSLTLPNTSTLTAINCDNNLLASLNVSCTTGITELTCTNNKLTFATLPVKQPTWSTYTYSPQQNISLPKQTYSTNEEIDLSSQLTVNGETTSYTWKTKGGNTLVEGTDFSANNGKFSFLKAIADSIYCEMENATFSSLTLSTKCIAIPLTPSVVMTTTSVIGSTFSFEIRANADNTPIQVDWGNGTLVNFTVGTYTTTISGTLTGNTIRVYGTGIKELNLRSKKLTALDVTKNDKLIKLDCGWNELTTIDVTKNMELSFLDCGSNKLNTLDVSNNTTLTRLFCHLNQLTSLDVSKNTLLTQLYCYSNQIETIDVSKNTALTYLTLSNNKLTVLDISQNNLLTDLMCYSNQLSTLNLSNNIVLRNLDCHSNKLNSIDVSNNTELSILDCYDNKITALDVTKNTGIKELNCNYNQLTAIDISKNTELKNFICSRNQIASLDVSKNTLLVWLDCSQNPIDTLDVSANVALTKFYCGMTMIKAIDVSKNTALQYFHCNFNNLPSLDVSKNTALTQLICTYNSLTSLDLSKNTALTYLSCDYNDLTELDLTANTSLVNLSCCYNYIKKLDLPSSTAIQTLKCYHNRLTISSLPIKQASWTSYEYNPQEYIKLSKTEYSISEEINLSSEISSNGNQTDYIWKTASGIVLTKDVDYSETNGVFAFIKTQSDFIYCEMTNATFPGLVIRTELIKVPSSEPTIIMSTSATAGSTFSFFLSANNSNNPIKVDWGNGILTDFEIGYYPSTISGTLSGKTIKIYGVGINYIDITSKMITSIDISNNLSLTKLYCSSNQLNVLDLTKNSALKNLNCSYNFLKFSSIPIKDETWISYIIKPQGIISLPKAQVDLDEVVDLSSEMSFMGISTTYVWKTVSGETLEKDVDYTENNGKFTFLKQPGDYFYCLMTNEVFPGLTLTTENISISQAEPAVIMTTTNPTGSTFSFSISTSIDNSPIKVDWGNGLLLDYNIKKTGSTLTQNLEGNTVKIYGIGVKYINLSSKELTALDVSKCILLKDLFCSSNQLSNLDVTKNIALTSLYCNSNQLTALDVTNNTELIYLYCYSNNLKAIDVTNNTALKELSCWSNQLKFSTLPIKQANWITYNYIPQIIIELTKKQYGLTETVDLSSEFTVNGKTTTYIWKTKAGATLTAGSDYNIADGVTTFLKVQADSVYCQMYNATFPGLTLTTTNIKVSQFPLSVSEDEIAVKVYPNPAKESFNLEMAQEIVRVEVYTSTGIKVYENELYNSTRVSVPLSSIPKGILLVKVFTRNGTYKSKVVKI